MRRYAFELCARLSRSSSRLWLRAVLRTSRILMSTARTRSIARAICGGTSFQFTVAQTCLSALNSIRRFWSSCGGFWPFHRMLAVRAPCMGLAIGSSTIPAPPTSLTSFFPAHRICGRNWSLTPSAPRQEMFYEILCVPMVLAFLLNPSRCGGIASWPGRGPCSFCRSRRGGGRVPPRQSSLRPGFAWRLPGRWWPGGRWRCRPRFRRRA